MKQLILILLFIPLVSFGQTAQDFYSAAQEKMRNGDYYNAISDCNKALKLMPNAYAAYNLRGLAKQKLEDYYNAISDFNKALEINPKCKYCWVNKGITKYLLKDYYGAISDYSKAIELSPNDIQTYINRANIKIENIGDLNGGCADLKKARALGDKRNNRFIAENCK